MSGLERGDLGAAEILASLMTGLSIRFPEGVGADPRALEDGGIAAMIVLPTGDRYAVAVRWVGDLESEAS